ncbi:MAG: serine/threonine protein kinase [Sandaracinaceae bacterium]|nr:serine/threonine protein kinase [Sandaracinaceae bacterium]
MFSVGDKIGVYEIVAELKSGGMATLFLGRRAGAAGFAKLVAIKVVHPHLAEDPTFVQMFVDEALLSARIQHPNVVHVEELRELDGHHFLVMEYVHGCSLGQLFRALGKRGRRLSPDLAIHIAIKVADGLHAAHETRDERGELLGVVHRDVSPQNILISYQGNVKLIDFGVAKAQGRVQQTGGGSIKGKFRYMSPEHAFAQNLDRRGDVYALGVVLWEILTMRRRFDGASDLDVLNAVRHPDVIPPSRYAPDLPAGLDGVLLKAMAKAPEDRYQTARELRSALVDVHPRAASLHESALGSLLAAVMAERIEKDREKLPSNVSGFTLDLPRVDPGAGKALETMTLSAEDIEELESGDTGDSLSGAGTHDAPTQVLPGLDDVADEKTVFSNDLAERMERLGDDELAPLPGPDTIPPPSAAPDPFAAPPPPLTPSIAAQPAEGIRVHPAVLALAVLVILLGAGGSSFLVVLALMSDDPPTVTTPTIPPPPLAADPTPPVTVAAPDAGAPIAAEARPDSGPVVAVTEPAPTPTRPDPTPASSGRRRRAAPTTEGRRAGTRRRGRPIASEW